MSATGVSYQEELVVRIRDLIDGYDSDSLLKEYLQNADDSGATELVVTFDKRQFLELQSTTFELASGPALLIANNSIFEEKDFKSVVKISAQGKANDAFSTGRFGQGFSSSFSVSDHPSFISNNRAYWFDVRKLAVSKNEENDILYWNRERFNEIDIWLNVFGQDNIKAILNQQRTVFRLPLRKLNTLSDSPENKISDEVFSYDTFLKWCDTWKSKAGDLIFLRNVHRLELNEIDENGELIVHLSIRTNNYKEIQEINETIQDEFKGKGLVDICQEWLETEQDLPLFKYQQNFSINYFDQNKNQPISYKEYWAVVNGLFRGPDNILLHQALEALNISPNPRKVLPWAGTAVQLDEDQKPIKQTNQWFTFLQLPIDSKHPVHLHGWFDLNPKRTEITQSGSGHDKEVLTTWNKNLLEFGVGVSWALLIDFIKSDSFLKDYYSFWPKPTGNPLDIYLVKGFYQKAVELPCIRTKYQNYDSWELPNTNLWVFKEEDLTLFDAFKEHFKIIIPKPTDEILKNFRNVKQDFELILPNSIREFLVSAAQVRRFPISLNDVTIKMLSQKDWLIAIATYCAGVNFDYSTLKGLPLELTQDSMLSIVGGNDVICSSDFDIELIQNNKALVLDRELIETLQSHKLPSNWLEPSLKNVISILLDNWDRFTVNHQWVELLAHFIYQNREHIGEAKEQIKRLEIVYKEDQSWTYLENNIFNSSAVLIKKDDVLSIDILKVIGLELIHRDYMHVYKPMANEGLMAKFNSDILARHLILMAEQNKVDFLYEDHVREYILEKLSEDIDWYDKWSDNAKRKFRFIPFIHAVDDKLYSLDSIKLYISTDFNPPKHIKGLSGDYVLVDTTNEKHLRLYKELGVQEQTAKRYIEEVILPFLENTNDQDEYRKVIQWLVEEWISITLKMDTEEQLRMYSLLRETKFIPDQLNFYKRKASDFYLPTFDLPCCLHDKKYLTIYFDDKELNHKWSSLLRDLKGSENIFASHLINKARYIQERANKEAYEDAICLANHITRNFEEFEKLLDNGRPVLDIMKEIAWLPVQDPSKYLLHPSFEYSIVMRPRSLIRVSDEKIIGGKYFVISDQVAFKSSNPDTEYEPRDIAKKLGLTVELPLEGVFDSFLQLTKIESTNEEVEKSIIEYSKEFYKYLGRRLKLSSEEIPYEIKQKCIRINQHWISSNYVFQRTLKLQGVFSWHSLLDQDEDSSNLSKGLELLGVNESPSLELYVELLSQIPRNEALESENLKQAITILRELQRIVEPNVLDDLPLLTMNNRLVNSDHVYINDLKAYDNAQERNEEIDFCHADFENLARKLCVDLLSECYESKINTDLTVYQEIPQKTTASIEEYIHHNAFKEALIRLLFDEDKIAADEINQSSLETILPDQIIIVRELVVDYFVYSSFLFREYEVSAHEDIKQNTLYILDQSDPEDMIESIAKYVCDAKDLSRDSFALISRIIREQLSRDAIEALLDKKHIRTLPQQLVLEEESIYDDALDEQYALNFADVQTDNYIDEDIDIEMDLLVNDEVTDESIEIKTLDYPSDNTNYMSSEENLQSDFVQGRVLNSNTDVEISSDGQGLNTQDEVAPPTLPQQWTQQKVHSQDSYKILSGSWNDNSRDVESYSNSKSSSLSTNNNRKSNDIAEQGGHSTERPFGYENNIVSSNDRKPVYVGKDKIRETEQTDESSDAANKIGSRGEEFILSHQEYLLSPTNKFERAPINNKGFDIWEKDSNDNIVRYIEVKTLTGRWGTGGVGITQNQLQYALTHGEKWWLIVIKGMNENAIEVYQFKNPVLEATSFMFDNSWQQLAYVYETDKKNELIKQLPKEGEVYTKEIEGLVKIYKITKVKWTEKLLYVWAKEEGQPTATRVEWNDTWEKIDE